MAHAHNRAMPDRRLVYNDVGVAPGWYGIGPLALLEPGHCLRRIRAPKARSIPAWGNAPGHR